ncbi:MAG: hypothetical protein HQ449_07955 [Chitinophagaceae bacterium]|jgi:hypothetical protein|nr:hypothetical protein [Chitinophagaceae bacterium]
MFLKQNLTAFLLFIIVLVAGQTILFNDFYVPVKINFVLTVNMMLFAMVYLNYIRLQRVDKTNPNALIRSVILGTLFKLIVFAGAALTYVKQAKEPVGYPTLLTSMALYLAYTWLEIKEVVSKK